MSATLVDFYINVVPLAAWVCYKEPTVGGRVLWVALLIALGSASTMVYLALQLLRMRPEEPLWRVLLRPRDAALLQAALGEREGLLIDANAG